MARVPARMRWHRQIGTAGERAAAIDLERRGFAIVARNLRFEGVEVDLLARSGKTLLLVEVKTRSPGSGPPPEAAVGAHKKAKLALAARVLAARYPHAELRVAVAAVHLGTARPAVITWFLDPLDGC